MDLDTGSDLESVYSIGASDDEEGYHCHQKRHEQRCLVSKVVSDMSSALSFSFLFTNEGEFMNGAASFTACEIWDRNDVQR